MARAIPLGFNFKTEDLDGNEIFIRDNLNLNLENWAKFRFAINVGVDSKSMVSPLPIPQEVRQTYRELAKAHYEVVTSLGNVNLALIDATQNQPKGPLIFFTKPVKDFYFHTGILLDNLARLIYLINFPTAAFKRTKRGLVRHFLDWNSVKNISFPTFSSYSSFLNDSVVDEMLNMRNNIAHNWISPMLSDSFSEALYWPLEIRTERNYYWLYEEVHDFVKAYPTIMPILQILHDDLKYLEKFQNNVFGQLTMDVKEFETNNGVTIC